MLDFSRLLPGPNATLWLARLGAEVIKVELVPEQSRVFASRVRSEWESLAASWELCLTAVLEPRTALEDRQVQSCLLRIHPALPPAPSMGRDTRSILAGIGLSQIELESLDAAGVIQMQALSGEVY